MAKAAPIAIAFPAYRMTKRKKKVPKYSTRYFNIYIYNLLKNNLLKINLLKINLLKKGWTKINLLKKVGPKLQPMGKKIRPKITRKFIMRTHNALGCFLAQPFSKRLVSTDTVVLSIKKKTNRHHSNSRDCFYHLITAHACGQYSPDRNKSAGTC